MKAAVLTNWVPIRVYCQAGRFMVDWCYLGQERFSEPFFDQTVGHQMRLPFNQLFRHQTSLDEVVELAAARSGVAPTGFIFHMSRCGSTLLAQMLTALPQNIVISEAGPIDAVLRTPMRDPTVTDVQRIEWLRSMVNALAWPRRAEETRFFVKFDSWHVLDLALIRRAFPDVPWIFLYRDPIEVMVSHTRQIGSQMVPGSLDPGPFGLTLEAAVRMPPAEYGARVLAAFCTAAVQQRDDHGQFVHYRQLPAAVWTTLAEHFGLAWTGAEIDRMRQVTQFDAKVPSLTFVNDSADKQVAALDIQRQLAEQWLMPPYDQLEAARAEQQVYEETLSRR